VVEDDEHVQDPLPRFRDGACTNGRIDNRPPRPYAGLCPLRPPFTNPPPLSMRRRGPCPCHPARCINKA
jgi:hypothetical protein